MSMTHYKYSLIMLLMPILFFLAHHILVDLKVSPLDKTAEVQLTLISTGHPETELKLKLCVFHFEFYQQVMINEPQPVFIYQVQLFNCLKLVCEYVCTLFFRNTDETVYKKVAAHPERLCKIDSVQLKNTGARFYRQGDIHFEYICISEVPHTR